MSRDQVYQRAIEYLLQHNVKPLDLLSEETETNYKLWSGSGEETNIPSLPCKLVWSFSFRLIEFDPNVIVNGGGCVVFVDDLTGLSTFYFS